MGNLAHAPEMCPSFTMTDRLRKAREVSGMDQAQLADALGIAIKTVSNYEHGKHAPREIVLRQWSLATGVSLHWLKTGEQPPGPLAQLVESRTFNPKSEPRHLHLVPHSA